MTPGVKRKNAVGVRCKTKFDVVTSLAKFLVFRHGEEEDHQRH